MLLLAQTSVYDHDIVKLNVDHPDLFDGVVFDTRTIQLANRQQQLPAAGDYRCWLVSANYRQAVILRVTTTLKIISPYQLPPETSVLDVDVQWQQRALQVVSSVSAQHQQSQYSKA
ncbi:hypothetical protein WP50_09285 [Lactiplantibacillus plantarum]|nr:hypothetical protein WP50_09285 [Lactiplantibacillus plantarum]